MVFVAVGLGLTGVGHYQLTDFKPPYYAARCIITQTDPYINRNILALYDADDSSRRNEGPKTRHSAGQVVYLPTIILVFGPLALLPFGLAQWLWIAMVAGTFLLANYLVWSVGAEQSPSHSGWLVFLCLGNSEVLLTLGNPAGLSVSLCVIAVWCFIRERFAFAGIAAMSISLLLKPHDAGPVWLYLLLSGGILRKRAVQTLTLAAILSIPAIFWVTRISPNWLGELHANLIEDSLAGAFNDPGSSTGGARGIGMMVNLQTVFSLIRNEPRFYNLATYFVVGPLLLVWTLTSAWARTAPQESWTALAAISFLTMLPTYHRQSDVPLVLLAVPACCSLWVRRGRIAKWAVTAMTAALVLSGELIWFPAYVLIENPMPSPSSGRFAHRIADAYAVPAPLALLAAGSIFLWVYVRSAWRTRSPNAITTLTG